MPFYQDAENKVKRLEEERSKYTRTIPNAPFKKTWDELTIKRMIKEAADNGYDAISWTPGEAQAARYDLSKQVKNINVFKESDGTFTLDALTNNNEPVSLGENIKLEKLSDVVGKDLANKISNQKNNQHSYSGLDLKVGGEGMKAFYDKMMVDKVNQLAKKFGGKVETKEINKIDADHEIIKRLDGTFSVRYDITDPNNPGTRLKFKTKEEAEQWRDENFGKQQPIHVLKLTPELKKVATEKGFPLFTGGLQFPKPLEQPTFEERWRERVPEGEMPVPAIRDFPTD